MATDITVPPSTIWEKADLLLKSDQLGTPTAEGLIDSTFAFEVYHPAFAERVGKMREFFWDNAHGSCICSLSRIYFSRCCFDYYSSDHLSN